ncbi:hypothetical protein Tco_0499791, partial [Tanacetum coccineum]
TDTPYLLVGYGILRAVNVLVNVMPFGDASTGIIKVQPDVETPSPFAIRLMESDANSGSCEVDVSAVESSDCVLPKAAANKIKRRYENSLVGFFVGMEQVLENGPWMIRKSPIILNKWSSSVISFTRALIEISSDSTLKDEVIMAILEEEGDGIIKGCVRVVYMEATALCRMYVAANKPSNTENNDEGFVEVKSQKNKGKDASRSIGDWTTSNTFDALNMVEEDVQDPSVQNCSKLDGEKCQEEDSLWCVSFYVLVHSFFIPLFGGMSGSEPDEMALESSRAMVLPKFDMHIYTSELTLSDIETVFEEYCILWICFTPPVSYIRYDENKCWLSEEYLNIF